MGTRAVKAACLVVIGASLAWLVAGCGHSIQTSGGPGPTPIPGPEFVYATNNADSAISIYSADAKTGILSLVSSSTTAGSGAGAAGLTATPNGKFLYALNSQTSEIFCFSINETTGLLTPTSQGSISTGAGTQPVALTLSEGGNFLYVVDKQNDQIFQYSVNAQGILKPLVPPTVSVVPSDSTLHQAPVSITYSAFATAAVFVANQNSGLIVSFDVAKNGGQLSISEDIPSLGTVAGIPNWLQISGATLYVADGGLNSPGGPGGQVSIFGVLGSIFPPGMSFLGAVGTGNSAGQPVGLWVDPFFPLLFTANDGADNASAYPIVATGLGTPSIQDNFTSLGNVTTDPTGIFFYGTDTSEGLIFQGSIATSTGAISPIGGGSIPTESPANPGSKPFQVIVVQTPATSP